MFSNIDRFQVSACDRIEVLFNLRKDVSIHRTRLFCSPLVLLNTNLILHPETNSHRTIQSCRFFFVFIPQQTTVTTRETVFFLRWRHRAQAKCFTDISNLSCQCKILIYNAAKPSLHVTSSIIFKQLLLQSASFKLLHKID